MGIGSFRRRAMFPFHGHGLSTSARLVEFAADTSLCKKFRLFAAVEASVLRFCPTRNQILEAEDYATGSAV